MYAIYAQNMHNICTIYVDVCTSCVAIVTLWTHDLRQKWTMVTTADNKAGGPPWPHSGCLNEVCPAFRDKYLQCAVSQKGQGYHFCSKLTMISVFLQNTQLVSNCVGFWKHGNMAIWQEDKMTRTKIEIEEKQQKRNAFDCWLLLVLCYWLYKEDIQNLFDI